MTNGALNMSQSMYIYCIYSLNIIAAIMYINFLFTTWGPIIIRTEYYEEYENVFDLHRKFLLLSCVWALIHFRFNGSHITWEKFQIALSVYFFVFVLLPRISTFLIEQLKCIKGLGTFLQTLLLETYKWNYPRTRKKERI